MSLIIPQVIYEGPCVPNSVPTWSTLHAVQQAWASTNGVSGCRTSPDGITALLSELFFQF